MKGSKSAHAIASCEVYAEVVDAAGNPDDIQIVNQKRQSYHSGGHLISTNCMKILIEHKDYNKISFS